LLGPRQKARDAVAILETLRPEDREAILGCFELGYSYDQLGAVLGEPSADAARVAVRRAVVILTDAMRL